MNNIKKVAIIGPECTGKSSLSEFLARSFNTQWVPEYAREYINGLSRPYEPEDLLHIAHGQLRLEDQLAKEANRILICDTNLYVIKIWSEFKYGYCDRQILNLIASRQYDLHLLTYVDIPWEEDPLREHPHQREQLFELYRQEMLLQSIPFIEIRGPQDNRRHTASTAIQKLLVDQKR